MHRASSDATRKHTVLYLANLQKMPESLSPSSVESCPITPSETSLSGLAQALEAHAKGLVWPISGSVLYAACCSGCGIPGAGYWVGLGLLLSRRANGLLRSFFHLAILHPANQPLDLDLDLDPFPFQPRTSQLHRNHSYEQTRPQH
jgi:hypothetical protein